MFRWLLSWLYHLWNGDGTPPRPKPPRRRPLSGFESLEDRNVPTLLPAGLIDVSFAAGLTNPTSMELALRAAVLAGTGTAGWRVAAAAAMLRNGPATEEQCHAARAR